MHRMNVVVEEEQYRALKERARRKRTSVSALLRDMIERNEATSGIEAPSTCSILDLVGAVEGAGDDAARRHDEILYGRP
jgi:predicted CopG family antitoxin